MKHQIFDAPGPQLAPSAAGPEPTLREIVELYYVKHDVPVSKAKVLTDEYVKNWVPL